METIAKEQQVEIHPAADLFPQMGEAEFQKLKDDIERCGVREPVSLDADGRLLDGRHRLRACQQLGMETPCQVYEGADVVDFVLSLNFSRRHLKKSQLAMVAARMANLPRGARTDLPQICGMSVATAAKTMGVSERLVTSASKALKEALPEIVSFVDEGRVAVNDVEAVVELPYDEQRALLEDGPAAVKAKAAELRQTRRVQARAKEVAPGSDEEAAVDTPAAVEASPVGQEESGKVEEADDGAGADTVAPPVDVVDSVPAEDMELPPVTDRDRELARFRLAPVEDAIDNLLDLPDPGVVAQLLHERGNLAPEDAEKAAWWVSEMAAAYRRCVSAKGKPPART